MSKNWLRQVCSIAALFLMTTPPAAIAADIVVSAAMAVMSFPLLVRAARTSFSEVNPRLEQIAATLGAWRWRIFFVITIPLAFRGVIAGSLLAFSRALGEFGATILLAGNIPGRTQTLLTGYLQLCANGQRA